MWEPARRSRALPPPPCSRASSVRVLCASAPSLRLFFPVSVPVLFTVSPCFFLISSLFSLCLLLRRAFLVSLNHCLTIPLSTSVSVPLWTACHSSLVFISCSSFLPSLSTHYLCPSHFSPPVSLFLSLPDISVSPHLCLSASQSHLSFYFYISPVIVSPLDLARALSSPLPLPFSVSSSLSPSLICLVSIYPLSMFISVSLGSGLVSLLLFLLLSLLLSLPISEKAIFLLFSYGPRHFPESMTTSSCAGGYGDSRAQHS